MEEEMERSLEHVEEIDKDRLETGDLERALLLLVDLSDLVHGKEKDTDIDKSAIDAAGTDLRRRALVLALATDFIYGIRGGRRAAATEAIGCAEAADPAVSPVLHRALNNLVVAKVYAAEGLDAELLERAGRLEASLPASRLTTRRSAPRDGSWYTDDLDTARAALQRSIARARDVGEDYEFSLVW